MIVSIDGPAAAGKSSVARGVARALGLRYLDTGAMYRALALVASRRGIAFSDEEALAALAAECPVELSASPDGPRVVVAGDDVTEAIRDPLVSAAVSEVSAHRGVRAVMVIAQREALRTGDWVAEGRDVGSNVAPEADVKVFLTASDRERARRRHADLAQRGIQQHHGEVLTDLRRRDELDGGRDADPLRVPEGALLIDSSDLDEGQVIERIVSVVREAGGG